ncbi:hypothetical protein CS542_08085 [Pedobacter sp. IW39]|nr:hypothetical protein CS542_08085 [Pedobacter sp. IW39]
MLIKYSNELNDFYDTDLTPAVFYNYPTIDGLAEFLVEEYQDKLLVKHQPELVFTHKRKCGRSFTRGCLKRFIRFQKVRKVVASNWNRKCEL